MPIRLQRFLHAFQIKADKPAESGDRNLAPAVNAADELHTHSQFGGQLFGVDPEPSPGFSSLTMRSLRTMLIIARRGVMLKDPWRGHEGTGGDTGGQKVRAAGRIEVRLTHDQFVITHLLWPSSRGA